MKLNDRTNLTSKILRIAENVDDVTIRISRYKEQNNCRQPIKKFYYNIFCEKINLTKTKYLKTLFRCWINQFF